MDEDAQNYKFRGKERDPDLGIDDFGARWYLPTLARFLQPDWSAEPAAVPYADLTDPQTLNLYSYVRNNPLATVDADGHSFADWDAPHGGEFAMDLDSYTTELPPENPVQQQAQNLSAKSEKAILNSNLTGEQAVAFEHSVVAAGNANGINPNVLVGMAMKESTLDPTAQSQTSTASGLFQLTASTQNAYGLSKADATGSSPSAITNQVNAAAGYLHDLMGGHVPSSHPSHQLEIGIGYFRGSRRGVNRAMASKGGYNAMLKLRYGGESLGRYIKYGLCSRICG